MTIRGWKKGSSHVVMILDQDEFYFFRLALMKSKKDHWPGDGTCNGHAYTVVNEICCMSFDEWMGSPKMVSPGEGRADKDGDCIAIALAEEIVNAGWCDAHCKDI